MHMFVFDIIHDSIKVCIHAYDMSGDGTNRLQVQEKSV